MIAAGLSDRPSRSPTGPVPPDHPYMSLTTSALWEICTSAEVNRVEAAADPQLRLVQEVRHPYVRPEAVRNTGCCKGGRRKLFEIRPRALSRSVADDRTPRRLLDRNLLQRSPLPDLGRALSFVMPLHEAVEGR